MDCGYKSGREFAMQSLKALAQTEMCHLYGTKNNWNISDRSFSQ
jgi:hypothetical protein